MHVKDGKKGTKRLDFYSSNLCSLCLVWVRGITNIKWDIITNVTILWKTKIWRMIRMMRLNQKIWHINHSIEFSGPKIRHDHLPYVPFYSLKYMSSLIFVLFLIGKPIFHSLPIILDDFSQKLFQTIAIHIE